MISTNFVMIQEMFKRFNSICCYSTLWQADILLACEGSTHSCKLYESSINLQHTLTNSYTVKRQLNKFIKIVYQNHINRYLITQYMQFCYWFRFIIRKYKIFIIRKIVHLTSLTIHLLCGLIFSCCIFKFWLFTIKALSH